MDAYGAERLPSSKSIPAVKLTPQQKWHSTRETGEGGRSEFSRAGAKAFTGGWKSSQGTRSGGCKMVGQPLENHYQ